MDSTSHAQRRSSPISIYIRDLYSQKLSPEDLQPVQLKAAPVALQGEQPLKKQSRSTKRIEMENLEIFLRNKRIHEVSTHLFWGLKDENQRYEK